ncbi:taste receptor type 1 member 3 [Rhinatrema bivittatum]|uniref:taste receptor type 1 member 3 n=1 Tax=Rhinatrema bivittatum TaxID=194408 RepID=UPI0011271F8A|nr:taste receptor type 1 member 3 [Rhinatrema bivittatum]
MLGVELLGFFCLLFPVGGRSQVVTPINDQAVRFSSPGDFVIGGMFPVHSSVHYPPLDIPTCTRKLLAMRFAIDEINNSSSLLPKVTLGYDIYDTCFETRVAMRPAMSFLSRHPGGDGLQVQCNYTDYRPRILAVVGPESSEECIILARLFNLITLPQVSYSASSDILRDRTRFPSFFQMVPSDRSLVQAMAQLVSRFQWNWVAVVGSDDEDGHRAVERFTELASIMEICVAYQDLIPSYASEPESAKRVAEIADGLVQSHVNVTLVFANEINVMKLMKALLQRNIINKVWLASEKWATSPSVAAIPDISSLGTVIGFAIKSGPMPGFREYVQRILANQGLGSEPPAVCVPGISRGKQCPECEMLTLANISSILDSTVYRTTFNTYTAVYALAHALHQLLQCDAGELNCTKDAQIYPWQLLEQMAKLNFTVNSHPIYMSNSGEPPVGYEIITWGWRSSNITPEFLPVGNYNPMEGKIDVDRSKIQWCTEHRQVPQSNCSQQCEPGQMKHVKDDQSCCYECESCAAGSFQNLSEDPYKCTPCPSRQWSEEKSTACSDRALEYMDWVEAPALLAAALTVLGLLLVAAVSLTLLRHQHTPAVQAAGGRSCLLMLLSLASVCCSIGLFLGKPSWLHCQVRQPLFSISFTVCLSVLLGKSLHLSGLCFPDAVSFLCVLLNLLIQGGLCSFWYHQSPPFVSENPNISASAFVIECSEGSFTGFGLLISYNGFLAVLCFMCTFMGRSVENSYKRARCITFSVLIYFLAWIFFIPTYTTSKGKTVPLFQVFSGLISIFGVLGAFFTPLCYIILFKPELNTLSYFPSTAEEPPGEQQDSRSTQLQN